MSWTVAEIAEPIDRPLPVRSSGMDLVLWRRIVALTRRDQLLGSILELGKNPAGELPRFWMSELHDVLTSDRGSSLDKVEAKP